MVMDRREGERHSRPHGDGLDHSGAGRGGDGGAVSSSRSHARHRPVALLADWLWSASGVLPWHRYAHEPRR